MSIATTSTWTFSPWRTFSSPRAAAAELIVWRALEELHDAGLLRAIGISNYSLPALERLWSNSRIKPAVLQCKYDPLHPGYQRMGPQPHEQADVVGWAHAHGMLVVGYSTLSGWPFLLRAADDPHVHALAARHGVTPATLLLRHAMQRNVCVIPSSANFGRLEANRAALSMDQLTRRACGRSMASRLLCNVEGAPPFRAACLTFSD